MYLRDCESTVIKTTKVTGGQNALMMTNCNKGKIYNNDFSFNSGLGIAMYRSSFNTIAYNKINFNVRVIVMEFITGARISAGILVYEQSNNNLFYKNSVTHGEMVFFFGPGKQQWIVAKVVVMIMFCRE
jgi:parallel beta-helix repeat protein